MIRKNACWLAVLAALASPVLADNGREVERIVAAPDACAWPNLQLLANGDILAFVFNQPSAYYLGTKADPRWR